MESGETFVISSDVVSKVKADAKYKEERFGKFKKAKKEKLYGKNKSLFKRDSGKKKKGKKEINPETLAKYSRGETGKGVAISNVKTKYFKHEQKLAEKNLAFTAELSARSELLHQEEAGFLEGDDRQFSSQIKQKQIKDAVDKDSAAKGFQLNLQQFGPYKLNYTKNGRHLVLGGRKGHIAAFDWQSKNLMCEINVMESVHDVQ